MRIVITGAAGFIGGHVARHFAARGHEAIAVARSVPMRRTAEAHDELEWCVADLALAARLPERFDALVHCAAELPSRTADPERLYRLNADMARNAFEGARRAGAKAVVFLSSMSVYGRISVPIVTEELVPNSPDPYGRAKLDAERMLEEAVRGGLESGLSLRLPGTVGRGSHHNFLSDVMARVLGREPVTASNPDARFNNIVYVGHLAAFLENWLARPSSGHSVANLAAADPIPIRDVISLIFSVSGQRERVAYVPGGKRPFIIDLARARALGYRPATVRASVEAFVRASR